MRYDIKLRLCKLGRCQRDVVRALAKRGITVHEARFSDYIRGFLNNSTGELVLTEADKIISAWESDEKQDHDAS